MVGGGKVKFFVIGCKGDLIDKVGCNGFAENGGLLRLGRGS